MSTPYYTDIQGRLVDLARAGQFPIVETAPGSEKSKLGANATKFTVLSDEIESEFGMSPSGRALLMERVRWRWQVEIEFETDHVSGENFENTVAAAPIRLDFADGRESLFFFISGAEYRHPVKSGPAVGSLLVYQFDVVPKGAVARMTRRT